MCRSLQHCRLTNISPLCLVFGARGRITGVGSWRAGIPCAALVEPSRAQGRFTPSDTTFVIPAARSETGTAQRKQEMGENQE